MADACTGNFCADASAQNPRSIRADKIYRSNLLPYPIASDIGVCAMKLLWIVAALSAGAAGLAVEAPAPTAAPELQKRYKEVIINKEYQKEQEAKKAKAEGKTTTSEAPKKWHRTIYSTQVEIVQPTVIAGVTFSAKPPTTTDGMEPWISLNKNGSPKTIKPKNKNGRIQNGSPTYGTWFATPTTVVYSKEELKAHNMADDEVYEHVEYVPEDLTYHSLNPILRCVPDYYGPKGMAKIDKTEPFCFPRENEVLLKDGTYFVTWFSRFFKDVEKVRIHLSLIKESARHKGMKREVAGGSKGPSFLEKGVEKLLSTVSKRSSVIEKGGSLQDASFWSSDWVSNDAGFLPLTIKEEWFTSSDWYKKVLILIQPESVSDEDFDVMKNSIVVEFRKGATVSKGTNLDLKKLEEKYSKEGIDYEVEEGIDEKYYVMMTMPLVVAIAALGMYIFVMVNKKSTDLSHLKRRKFAGKNTTHRRVLFKKKQDYSELPQFNDDIEMTKRD